MAFDVTDGAVKDLLKNCASGEKKYFDAASGAGLEVAFKEIAEDFNPIRLAR